MSDTGRKSVLARKADLVRMRGRRKATELDFGAMPVKALNRAVKRAGMPMKALGIEPREETVSWDQTLGEVAAMLPEGGLLVVLEGEDRARGLLHLHQGLLDGLIEVQTTGAVDHVQGQTRPATGIDAALARDFIDLLLSALATELEDLGIPNVFMRMHFGSPLDDRRQLPLLVPERGFHVFRCKADLAGGAKVGTLVIALPGAAASADLGPKRPADPQWRAAFHRTLSQSRIGLETVLFRREIPLKAALSLLPGTVIPFETEAMEAVRVEDRLARAVVKGRLGQAGGKRALKLTKGAKSVTGAPPEMQFDAPSISAPPVNAPGSERRLPVDPCHVTDTEFVIDGASPDPVEPQ